MTCADKIYEKTYARIPITYADVLTSDIADLYVKFVNRNDPSINKTYLLSTGGVEIVSDVIYVIIEKTDITTHGIYDIYMKRTNLAGKEIGSAACPSWVLFYQML